MAVKEKQIAEIEQFFEGCALPKIAQLQSGVTITNCTNFVESLLSVIKSNVGKPVYDVFYPWLIKLKEIPAISSTTWPAVPLSGIK